MTRRQYRVRYIPPLIQLTNKEAALQTEQAAADLLFITNNNKVLSPDDNVIIIIDLATPTVARLLRRSLLSLLVQRVYIKKLLLFKYLADIKLKLGNVLKAIQLIAYIKSKLPDTLL